MPWEIGSRRNTRKMNQKTKVVNLTPHRVDLFDNDDVAVASIEPSGTTARLSDAQRAVGSLIINEHSIELVVKEYGPLVDLPERSEGVLYIASALAATAAYVAGRRDVVCPNDLVRGPDGQVIGCRSLALCPPAGGNY